MTETRKTVLLTGATGYIAGQLLPALRERYDVTVQEVETAVENVEFKVPRALREPA